MADGKILYVGGFVLPDGNAAANRVVSNGKLFSDLGLETLFCGLAPEGESFEGIRKVNGHGDMFELARPRGTREWAKRVFSPDEILSFAAGIDGLKAIVLYNQPYATLLAFRKAFSGSGTKICCDFTEWTAYTDGSAAKKAFKYFDEKATRRLAPAGCDGVIAVSSAIEAGCGSCPAVLRLPPLTDTHLSVWQERPERGDRFTFAFVGVPDGAKDRPELVVKAFERLGRDDARLVMIGLDRDDFLRLCPGSVRSADDAGISFLGRLPHDEAIRRLRGSDCAFFLREDDRRNGAGFPTKFVEAFTCGIPVVTTLVSDVGGYIRPGFDEIAASASPEDAAAAMEKVLSRGRQPLRAETAFDYRAYKDAAGKWLEKLGVL